jgi:uncharacterized membrane protein YfcA
MTYLVICTVALLASALTFFSGFGLGTLLLPAFALFFPVEQAIAMTALVHMLNGLFKFALVGRHADRAVVVRFGVPAILAAFVGAWALSGLADMAPLHRYIAFGHAFDVMPVKLAVGVVLLLFATIELVPQFRDLSFKPRWMPIGGLLSGFFGGLAGMQGALRSAFLARAGLSKEAFIATGVTIALLIDFSRLGVYAKATMNAGARLDGWLLGAAVVSAFLGAWLGNRHLKKMTMPMLQKIVAASLFVVALALASGLI